jgi:hypothetical protein
MGFRIPLGLSNCDLIFSKKQITGFYTEKDGVMDDKVFFFVKVK